MDLVRCSGGYNTKIYVIPTHLLSWPFHYSSATALSSWHTAGYFIYLSECLRLCFKLQLCNIFQLAGSCNIGVILSTFKFAQKEKIKKKQHKKRWKVSPLQRADDFWLIKSYSPNSTSIVWRGLGQTSKQW